MEVRTRVREVHDNWARLVCDGAGRCDVCGAGPGAGCGSSPGASDRRCLVVPRSSGGRRALRAGDVVVVSVAEEAIVRVAALTYLLPWLGLLTGAGLAALAGVGDGGTFLAATGGAVAGVGLGRRAASRGFRAVSPRAGNADA
jgi:positive regulator of sigma E activity